MRNFIDNFSDLSCRNFFLLQLAVDASLRTVSFFGAMLLRLESFGFAMQSAIWAALLCSVLVAMSVSWGLGLYRVIVRLITGKILFIVSKGVLAAGISLYAAGLLFDAGLPRSVPIIFAVFACISIGGLRFAARTYFRSPNHANKRPVIIYGAGEAGLQLLNALFHGHEFVPVALVDDEPSLQNMSVGGLRVHSPDRIPHLVQMTGAGVILPGYLAWAMPNSSSRQAPWVKAGMSSCSTWGTPSRLWTCRSVWLNSMA